MCGSVACVELWCARGLAGDVNPRVSVGLPVYNGERFIEQSVRSLLTQTFTDFELIISDNASTDSTIEIVERVCAGDPRVRIVCNPENRGAAWNYNRVFELSTGEYFRWHAHDDWCEPDHLARLVAALDSAPGASLAHTETRFVDDDNTTLWLFDDDLRVDSARPSDRLASIVQRLTYCNAVFGLMPRSVLERTALIAPFPRSDVSLLYELAYLGQFVVVPGHLFVARPGRSTQANPTNQMLSQWFSPSGRGARVPAFWLWWASVTAIWRADYSWMERCRATVVFHRFWPVEYARQARRRRRRLAKGVPLGIPGRSE